MRVLTLDKRDDGKSRFRNQRLGEFDDYVELVRACNPTRHVRLPHHQSILEYSVLPSYTHPISQRINLWIIYTATVIDRLRRGLMRT